VTQVANTQARDDVRVMQAAMQWLLRMREETLTERDIAAWMNWYEADESHKKVFDEMQEFWQQTGGLGEGSDGVARLQRLGKTGPANLRPSRSLAQVALAMAAGLGLLAVGVVLWRQYYFTGSFRVHPTAATNSASVRSAVLSDGSRVDIAAKSSVAVQFTSKERRVELREGEAYFSVAPNRTQPFVVAAGPLRVRAIGTAFNVRRSGERIVVTVDKGAVDVYSVQLAQSGAEAAKASVRVNAGNEVKWDEGASPPVVASVDPSGALAWREGRLEYINEPLAAVIADVNRYSARHVEIPDPAVANLTFTGTVFTGATDEWLHALPGEFPVALVTARGSSAILVVRRAR